MVVERLERERTDRVFAALSDATRRDIVTRVLNREASVSDLARHYEMSFAAVQKHVAVLERAQLVSKHRRGREQLVRGEVGTVRTAARLLDRLEQTWLHRIAAMDAILDQLDTEHGPDRPTDQGDPS